MPEASPSRTAFAFLSAVPLLWARALRTLACVTHGSTIVLVQVFQPAESASKRSSASAGTVYHGVPTMFIALLEHPELKTSGSACVQVIMAARRARLRPCAQVHRRDGHERGDDNLRADRGVAGLHYDCHRRSHRKAREYRRAYDAGRRGENRRPRAPARSSQSPGQIGEFCARGYNIMRGYYKNARGYCAER